MPDVAPEDADGGADELVEDAEDAAEREAIKCRAALEANMARRTAAVKRGLPRPEVLARRLL